MQRQHSACRSISEQLVTQLKSSANNSAVERECVADITKARSPTFVLKALEDGATEQQRAERLFAQYEHT